MVKTAAADWRGESHPRQRGGGSGCGDSDLPFGLGDVLISVVGAHQAGCSDDAGAGLAVCGSVDPGLAGLEVVVGADRERGSIAGLIQDHAIFVGQVCGVAGACLRVADQELTT